VLSDTHVSRAHATVADEAGVWTIVSIGRHGTLVNDRMVSEAKLDHQTTFRLGAEGPMLRFDAKQAESNSSQTIDNVGGDMLAMLKVDAGRKQQEVDQIVGNALFQQLKEKWRRVKLADVDDTATK
jgi:pSer/pThr/pTyr-binding forkhead associated (FHA) protein